MCLLTAQYKRRDRKLCIHCSWWIEDNRTLLFFRSQNNTVPWYKQWYQHIFAVKKNTKKEHEIAIFYAQKINNEIKLTDLCMLLSHLSLICSLWKKIIRLTNSAYDKKNLASLIKNVMNNNLFFLESLIEMSSCLSRSPLRNPSYGVK